MLMGFSHQEHWSGLPFPPPVDHILSELSTMTHLSWVSLHGMAHSFIEWALGSITMNKASGGGMEFQLHYFQTLKDDAVKVLHSIC